MNRAHATFSSLAAACILSLAAGAVAQGPGAAGPIRPIAPDPRVGLAPGMHDAGMAAKNVELVLALPKPAGFDDPQGTGGLAFANSDLAFSGTMLIQGNFHGLNFFNIADPAHTTLLTSLVCPGGQGDISVYGHLAFMSVEAQDGRIDCGIAPPLPPPPPGTARGARVIPPDPHRFRGVRIFDISDPARPRQVAAVQTCRGSHTHTIVPDPHDPGVIYVYGQGTAGVRSPQELAGCDNGNANDPNSSLYSIDVIRVPLAAPQKAAIVNRPRVFADADTGALSGLWQGGNHGVGTQTSRETNQCHDITAYPALGLAAGACAGNGILLDIADPAHPRRIDDVADPNFSYWHSATFSNDGTKVVFTDEWGGGTQPRCRATDPVNWGGDAIFNLVDRRLKFAGYYKMPAVQTDQENCVAHNGGLIPVPGRDILAQAWYQGGMSVMDFTDAAHPVEIAYFDRGPINATKLVIGGYWSTYWYNGYIYGSEIARGLDVFRLLPSDLLSQNEIDAANLVHYNELNVQSQPTYTWPASYVIARAYLDQLERSKSLDPDRLEALRSAMSAIEAMPAGAARGSALGQLDQLAASLDRSAAGAPRLDAARMKACAATITQRDAQLRR